MLDARLNGRQGRNYYVCISYVLGVDVGLLGKHITHRGPVFGHILDAFPFTLVLVYFFLP